MRLLINRVLQGAAFPAAAEAIPDKPAKIQWTLMFASLKIRGGCGMLQSRLFESCLLNKPPFICIQQLPLLPSFWRLQNLQLLHMKDFPAAAGLTVSCHFFSFIFRGFCNVKQLLFVLGNVQVGSCLCLAWQQTSQPSIPGAGFCNQLWFFDEIWGFWGHPSYIHSSVVNRAD